MEKIALVGYTGFVGSNIALKVGEAAFYNSKNISDAYGTDPDVLIYAGLRAEKFIANKFPERDFDLVKDAIRNIELINPQKIVLISTIDVYNNPVGVTEDNLPDEENLAPYGKNRLYLENWIKDNFDKYCIVRLPGLFGKNIKKNFIYDMINIVPSKLNQALYEKYSAIEADLSDYYLQTDDGFYTCKQLNNDEKDTLIRIFDKLGFNAMNFTDSEGYFQFYNLEYLYSDIVNCLKNDINVINLATEPIKIEEIYKYIYDKDFVNRITDKPPFYDFRTKYDVFFGGNGGYIKQKEEVLAEIKSFICDGGK